MENRDIFIVESFGIFLYGICWVHFVPFGKQATTQPTGDGDRTSIALGISLFNYGLAEINRIKGKALEDGVNLFILPLTDINRK